MYKFYIGDIMVYKTNSVQKAKEMANILSNSSWRNKLMYNSIS